jgi:hypothetical protein
LSCFSTLPMIKSQQREIPSAMYPICTYITDTRFHMTVFTFINVIHSDLIPPILFYSIL